MASAPGGAGSPQNQMFLGGPRHPHAVLARPYLLPATPRRLITVVRSGCSCKGVSLSCLCVVARKLPRLLCGPCVSRSLPGEVLAHRPSGSSQTDRIRLPYAAGNIPPRLSFSMSPATYEERGLLVCASRLYISLKPRIEIISFVSSLLRSSSST